MSICRCGTESSYYYLGKSTTHFLLDDFFFSLFGPVWPLARKLGVRKLDGYPRNLRCLDYQSNENMELLMLLTHIRVIRLRTRHGSRKKLQEIISMAIIFFLKDC